MLQRYGLSENFAGSEVHVAVISLEDCPALLWWVKKSPLGTSRLLFCSTSFYYGYVLLQTQVKITLQRRIGGKITLILVLVP